MTNSNVRSVKCMGDDVKVYNICGAAAALGLAQEK